MNYMNLLKKYPHISKLNNLKRKTKIRSGGYKLSENDIVYFLIFSKRSLIRNQISSFSISSNFIFLRDFPERGLLDLDLRESGDSSTERHIVST